MEKTRNIVAILAIAPDIQASRQTKKETKMNFQSVSRNRIGLLMATVLAGGLFACAQQPLSQETDPQSTTSRFSSQPSAPAVVRVSVAGGTQIHVILSTDVGSATSQVGDTLRATTTTAVLAGGRVAIPEGSTIYGRVTEVVPATKGLKISEKGGAVALSFSKVTTPQGYSTPLSASLVSVAKSSGKTAGIIGGSAAGGALLGKILGGSTKDAAVGAVLGAGIGTGIAAGTKGTELVIPAGTHLILTLDQSLTIADRS